MKTIILFIGSMFGIVYHAEIYNISPVFWGYVMSGIIILILILCAVMFCLIILATYKPYNRR